MKKRRERTGLPYTTIGLILSGTGVGGILYSFIAAPLVRRTLRLPPEPGSARWVR